jgi:hypothetical protein
MGRKIRYVSTKTVIRLHDHSKTHHDILRQSPSSAPGVKSGWSGSLTKAMAMTMSASSNPGACWILKRVHIRKVTQMYESTERLVTTPTTTLAGA